MAGRLELDVEIIIFQRPFLFSLKLANGLKFSTSAVDVTSISRKPWSWIQYTCRHTTLRRLLKMRWRLSILLIQWIGRLPQGKGCTVQFSTLILAVPPMMNRLIESWWGDQRSIVSSLETRIGASCTTLVDVHSSEIRKLRPLLDHRADSMARFIYVFSACSVLKDVHWQNSIWFCFLSEGCVIFALFEAPPSERTSSDRWSNRIWGIVVSFLATETICGPRAWISFHFKIEQQPADGVGKAIELSRIARSDLATFTTWCFLPVKLFFWKCWHVNYFHVSTCHFNSVFYPIPVDCTL